MLTRHQIAATWWPEAKNPRRASSKRLSELERSGLIRPHRVSAHPLLELYEPVSSWAPGDPDPDHHQVSYRLQSRWTQPNRLLDVFIATRKAGKLFGGVGGKLSPLGHETHDLHTAVVYLHHREVDPDRAKKWRGEDLYKDERAGQKLPDAMLFSETGEAELVVEFGGAYNVAHVAAFHEDCDARDLPYELW